VVSSGTQRLPRATARDPAPSQEARFASNCARHPSCFALLGNGDLSSQEFARKSGEKHFINFDCDVLIGVTDGQTGAPGKKFENQYLTMTILPACTVGPSVDQTLNIVQGKYLLAINPIFTHPSGVTGGRFSEIVGGMPSIDAVMGKGEQLAVASNVLRRRLRA
jgi:hypothetical protein